MIDRFEKFSLAISEIHRCIVGISSSEMKKHGLSGTQARYLIIMNRLRQGITSARLAILCSRNKAEVSRAIAALEKIGLAEREDNPKNYRTLIQLTDKGREVAEKITARAKLAVESVGGFMSTDERERFYDTLELLATNLIKIEKNGLPD